VVTVYLSFCYFDVISISCGFYFYLVGFYFCCRPPLGFITRDSQINSKHYSFLILEYVFLFDLLSI